MTNLGGHDLEALLEAFHGVPDDRPHCFIAYTVKGWGLPLAGHKDNHAGLMNAEQMAALQASHRRARRARNGRTAPGWMLPPPSSTRSWNSVPFRGRVERHDAAPVAVPDRAAAGPARRGRLDPGGVRADHGRARPQRPAAGGEDRDHLARRHGLDQPRRLGRPARAVQPPRARGRVPRRAGAVADTVAREPARANISSSASPRTTCSSTSPAWASPTSCSAPACCRWARSTIRSSPAASMP